MKVLFAVSNEAVSESIVKKYQEMYKEIIVGKNVYYFNAILKEIQKDKTYDRIVISEDLEPFTSNNYDTIDNFIFERLDNISDEAATTAGEDIPIILIATDRRTKSDNLLIKLFGIGVYSALLGQDRSIEEVCKLINKPRSKKEAKIYYKIDSNDVEYKPESEDDVSETEIQNILTHYRRLGRNEDRYVESFENIAAQYTDEQLKVIIKFLPLNVKAVLEANCPRYQQLTSFRPGKNTKLNNYQSNYTSNRNNNTNKAISNDGIKIESIPSGEKKLTKPVIIPSANTVRRVQKTNNEQVIEKLEALDKKVQPNIEEKEEFVETPKRGRGRPKKEKTEEVAVQEVKEVKRRGRPRKNPIQEVNVKEENYNEETLLPGFEQIQPIEEDNILPGFAQANNDYEESNTLPGFEDNNELSSFEENETLPGFEQIENNELEYENNTNYNNNYNNYNEQPEIQENTNERHVQQYYNNQEVNLESLLSKDKKIVAFVGTTKNGTSFLVNNLAQILSNQGIKTAILDLTKNRNAYYIYTKNEEALRKTAFSCIEDLEQGIVNGIKVNNNLDVYTSLPGEANSIEEGYASILETLVKNYSLILLDCDFTTQYQYLKNAQEIVPYCTIPFDGQVYSKYLEGLVNCNISVNGYSKEVILALRKLANMVYPLISNNYGNAKYNNPKYNKYSTNTFSDNMTSTLDKMKRNY